MEMLITSPGGSGLTGPHRVVTTRYKQTENQHLGHMVSLEFSCEVIWNSQVRAGMEDSNHRSGVWVSIMEVLFNDT